jgi:proteasome accessory factor A
MSNLVPKYVGFEIELGNGLLDSPDEDGPLRACQAIVGAHHYACGPRPDLLESAVNEFDKHGFRVYVDHLHAELSSPLAPSATGLVLLFRAALQLLRHFKRAAEQETGPLYLALDNTNRRGVSWGAHMNVLVSRKAFDAWRTADWKPLHQHWVPFVVTSPALLGAGKIGAEAGARHCAYQMSQRADFVDRIVGLETVTSKSIINERDEPLADPSKYARMHIIPFDTNRMEFAHWLKFGVAQLLLALVEEGYPLPDLTLKDPLATFATCSRDIHCRAPLALTNSCTMSALEIQYRLAETVYDAVTAGTSASEVPDAKLVLTHWLRTLDGLARNDKNLVRRLDWRARLALIERARQAAPDDPNAQHAADLSYGEVGGLFEVLEVNSAVDTLEKFVPIDDKTSPLMVPRERLRSLLISRFGRYLVNADWHRLVFETPNGDFWHVDMSDPRFGNQLCSIAEKAPNLSHCLKHPEFATIAKPVVVEAEVATSD